MCVCGGHVCVEDMYVCVEDMYVCIYGIDSGHTCVVEVCRLHVHA